jgi:hypothetical protein
VLENAPVSLLLDVLQIIPGGSVGGILLAHVTEPAGELGQALAIGALSEPFHLKVVRLQKDWTREECYYGFCIEQGSRGRKGNCN